MRERRRPAERRRTSLGRGRDSGTSHNRDPRTDGPRLDEFLLSPDRSQQGAYGRVSSVDGLHDLRLDEFAALLWKLDQHNIVQLEPLHVVLHRHADECKSRGASDRAHAAGNGSGSGALAIRREVAERLVEEVRGDDPKLASYLRIEECELEAGG